MCGNMCEWVGKCIHKVVTSRMYWVLKHPSPKIKCTKIITYNIIATMW